MICRLCEKPILAKGLCSKHYTRLKKHGDTSISLSPHGQAQEFMKSLPVTGECIIWPFKAKMNSGYGSFSYNGTVMGAHRASCIIHNGPPPEGYAAAHSCGNKLCVNPRHLRWATYKQNEKDKKIHGTDSSGERNAAAKLKIADVINIRNIGKSMPQHVIAEKFGISRRAVGLILSRKTWREI